VEPDGHRGQSRHQSPASAARPNHKVIDGDIGRALNGMLEEARRAHHRQVARPRGSHTFTTQAAERSGGLKGLKIRVGRRQVVRVKFFGRAELPAWPDVPLALSQCLRRAVYHRGVKSAKLWVPA
jgi:hypothetical protein